MYCDRLVVLRQGRVVAAGTPHDVLTESLIAAVYGVRATGPGPGPGPGPGEGPHIRFLGPLP